LDSSQKALDSFYELTLPDDEETGEPDEDLPFFDKHLPISSINENKFTLIVANPKAIKVDENAPSGLIQSINGSFNQNPTDETISAAKGNSINASYHSFTDENTASTKSANDTSNSSRCCCCTIF
jgi:hypothetical protein